MIIDNKSYTGDGSTRQYATSAIILSNSHIAVFLNNVLQPTNSYDLLGSVVLFKTAPSNGVAINFVVSDTGEDLPVAPNEYNTVYANITEIQNISAIIDKILNVEAIKTEIVNASGLSTEIVDLYNNRLAILGVNAINTDITSLNSIKAKLESLYADKTTLDSLYADKLTLDTLYSMKEKLYSLYADKNTLDSLYADKTELDSIYANLNSIISIYENIDNVNYFADRYLGDRDIEPTTRIDGSSLLNGDLYFDKKIQLMRVYSNDGWKVAYASNESYTKSEIENLFVGVSGDQTVYDVKTFNLPIVGRITGNSGSATKLETARKINGVDFDGTVDIVVVDDTGVKITGNQTIVGVKTFSESPIVPTPINNGDAVNKEYVDSNGGTLPIGAILNAYTIFDNCIVAFGGEFNRADYPKLWAYLQANPTLLKTQAQWQSQATANGGICGFFSYGNGTTTFRVPNLDKAFLRHDSRGVGTYEADEFKSHSHGLPGSTSNGTTDGSADWNTGNTTSVYYNTRTAGGTETRPKNIAVLPLIVAK